MKLFDVGFFLRSIPQILTCLPITIIVSFVSFFFSVVIGLAAAVTRIYKIPVLDKITAFYISFIRGTPVLVQLYIICYGIPKVIYWAQLEYGWWENFNVNAVPGMVYVLVAYSFNIGAYMAETIRSSIEAVDRGQFEAAKSVGMTSFQVLSRIVIPQAFVIAVPNLGNSLISAVKDTSLMFVAGLVDVMAKAKIIGARAYNYLEVYIAAALIYWATCMLLELMFKLLEKKVSGFKRKVV